MSIRTRLQHLERLAPLPACPECLDRVGKTVLVIRREPSPGQDPEDAGSPLPCLRCGAVPEQIVEVIETVVEGRASI